MSQNSAVSMRKSVTGFVTIVAATAAATLPLLSALPGPGPATLAFSDWLAVAVLVLVAVLVQSLSAAIVTSSGVRAFRSVAAIPYLSMVPLFGPLTAALGSAIAESLVSLVVRRLPKIKATFNIAQLVVAVGAAGLLYVCLLYTSDAADEN